MATGILFGLAPALQLSRAGPRRSAERRRPRLERRSRGADRHALVVAEIALSLVLLSGAGLLVRSLIALQRVEPGFVAAARGRRCSCCCPDRAIPTRPRSSGSTGGCSTSAASAPGVQSAAVATTLPLSGSSLGAGFTIDGRPLANPADRPTAAGFAISPEYFATMGIPLLRGRAFTARDDENAPPVAIINETMARRVLAERGSDREAG